MLRRRARGTRTVGPEPDTTAPSAPASSPASSVCRSAGRSASAAGCRSLRSAAPSATASPGAQRGQQRRRRSAARAPAPRRAAGRTRRRPPASTARRRRARSTQWNVPRASTGVSRSPRPVPSAVPPCSANGTSLPSSAASAASSSRGSAGAPQRVAGDQRGGRVGAAAGHPAATGMPLVMCRRDAGRRGPACSRQQHARRAAARLVGVERDVLGRRRRSPASRVTVERRRPRVAMTSSYSATAWKTVARSWKPSGRRRPTDSWRLTFAGARTVTDGHARLTR